MWRSNLIPSVHDSFIIIGSGFVIFISSIRVSSINVGLEYSIKIQILAFLGKYSNIICWVSKACLLRIASYIFKTWPLVTLLVPCLQGNYPLVAFLLASLQGMITHRDFPATNLQGIQPLVALLVAGLQGIKSLEAFLLSQGPHTENRFRCS